MRIRRNNNSPRLVGYAVLGLLFCASACLTGAYFSSQAKVEAQTQAAAAAATALPNPFDSIFLEAKAVYVKDLTTGKVLFARNSDAQLPLASLTKVATALAVSEVLPPETVITIPRDTAPPGSKERLAAGERWSVEDVLNFTLIASSNGGAEILAEAADEPLRVRYPAAPEGSAALWRMNELARLLGLSSMYFLNVSGLDVSTTQAGAFGSARDVGTLFSYALSKNPVIFGGTARDGMLFTSISGSQTSALNTDKALGSIPGLVMGKTGYTDLAGGNLAVVFDVGPSHPVVAVVLGSSFDGRFTDMKSLVAATQEAVASGY